MAAQQPAASGQNGVMIGKFRRLESIGKGSFAVVYKAVHPDDQSLVAIKTVHHSSLKGKLKQNLFSEIDILKRVHHPHIVALLSILESSNHIHLVMEFCQLGDLATFIKKRDKLAAHPVTADMIRKYPNPPNAGFNEVVVRHYAKQLSAALKFLRDKDLVHRDLKPQNLLLNPPPSYISNEPPESRPHQVAKNSLIPETGIESLPSLKIADFGFARYLPTTTMAETLCGSPLYMAPEILSYQKYDAKADLWSVGTVLYELMVGKPPFRAANHVDLLRRIEKAQDNIKFPDDLVISSDMSKLIRGLLKKSPTERMSWNDFFENPVNSQRIPGLVGADRKSSDASESLQERPQAERRLSVASTTPARGVEPRDLQRGFERRASTDRTPRNTPPANQSPLARKLSSGSPRTDRPLSQAAQVSTQTSRTPRNPQVVPPERRRSQYGNGAGPSSPREPPERETLVAKQQDKTVRESKDKAAQDIAFEREYVMVEKRAVEINAFADELAASPKIQGGSRDQAGAMVRRATTQGLPSTSAPSGRSNPLTGRPDVSHQRRPSYERRYGAFRGSAQEAIGKALNMVNLRLYGGPLGPAFGRNASSPPQPYGPFPAFPATQTTALNLGDSPLKTGASGQDARILSAIEESATRSDVVYGFAEVKYQQLIPIAPSNENPLGIRRQGGEEDGNDDDVLTPDAIVSISEEALVLYVKALGILTNTINVAGFWWSQKGKEFANDNTLATRPGDKPRSSVIANRVNNVVQWARDRFNECLEKSEYVSRRLIDAQQKLPEHHPGHPNNHQKQPESQHRDLAGSEIHLSTGMTAEKLMYDRALDMSRTAAVNELVGEDLPGCEMNYMTAIRLLEAVLEESDELKAKSPSSPSKREKAKPEDSAGDGIDQRDRETVEKLIEGTRKRLSTLRRKLNRAHAVPPKTPAGEAQAELISTSAPAGESRLSSR